MRTIINNRELATKLNCQKIPQLTFGILGCSEIGGISDMGAIINKQERGIKTLMIPIKSCLKLININSR